ncbi:DUF192 domain-containing protein [Inhella sp.]|uniref:DUF192 domain-containing protein n=1 Tax=Inhella sp. TaxID=1921806 RepID=UPI0035B4A7A8
MTVKPHALFALLACLAATLFASATLAQSAQRLPTVELRAGMHRIQAQLARTEQQRAIGLMHVKEMPQHEGMLFVFEQPGTQCFWMRNTLIPLSIAFLTDEGEIVNVEEMQALDDRSNHCSAKPVRFALEMNATWFAKRGLKPGSKLSGPVFR